MNNRWVKFSFIYLGAFVISMSQLKIAPTVVLNPLSAALGISESSIQLLSSIFSVSGIFLAIPGGILMSRIGARRLVIILMACLAIGNFLGYFSIHNYYLLLVSRIVEGVSFAMYLMVAMVYIRYWFADDGSGTALGIFGTYSALASMLILNIAAPIVGVAGFESLWIILGVTSLITMLAFIFMLEDVKSTDKPTETKSDNYLQQAMANKGIWVLALCHGCMTYILFTLLQIYPSMFDKVYHLTDVEANGYSSILGLAGIPTGVLAGILIDKLKSPVTVGMIGFVCMALGSFVSIHLQNWMFIPYLFIFSTGISFAYTAVMMLASSVSNKPEITGYSVSIVNTVYYFMIVVGSPLTMTLILKAGWGVGFTLLGSVGILGLLGILFYQKAFLNKQTNEGSLS